MKKRITSLILAVVTVFALIPAMAFSATAEDAAATTPEAYNALYVQDGLTMLLTAFDAASAAAYQASGKWASRVGSAEATLIGSGWKAGENGGLYFNLAGQDAGNEIGEMWGSHKLDMGIANLPAEDFTLEMVVNPIGYTVNADGKTQLVASANGTSTYGMETHLGFIIGPLRTNSFPSLGSSSGDVNSPLSNRVNSFANNESRWIYGDGVADWGNQGMKQPWGFKNENVLAYTGAAFTWTLTHDLDDAKTDFTYELSRNSAVQWTLARGDDTTGAYIAANDTQPFWLFRSFPTTMYAVRVYNRVLTAEERNWNHFVDILAYAGIDLSGALYTGLSETQKKELAAEFETWGGLRRSCLPRQCSRPSARRWRIPAPRRISCMLPMG